MSTQTVPNRTISISLPEWEAMRWEDAAQDAGRDLTELLREGFRMVQLREAEAKLAEIRASHPQTRYTADDVEGLVKEVRREMAEERREANAGRS